MDIKQLCFAADKPPRAVIAAAKIAGIPLSIDASLSSISLPSFLFHDGSKLEGEYVLLRHIGRTVGQLNLYGKDAVESAQIDEWLDYIPIFVQGSEFEMECSYVESYLSTNTFLVGHSLSIADIALWSALSRAPQQWETLMKSCKFENLVRWYNSIGSDYGLSFNEVPEKCVGQRGFGRHLAGQSTQLNPHSYSSSLSSKVHEKTKACRCPDVDLPNAEVGKVCLRFAPEPSGYLHIGHSKAALLNKYFAEKYKGRLIVRLDDTNPAKESNEFVENLLKDIESLGIVYDAVTFTSDYFPHLLEMAENLIYQGKAYVDDTPVEQMRKERDAGIESKCRKNGVEKNIYLWNEMLVGSDIGVRCCLRGKLDFANANKCLRDPVYYRCNPTPHHRVGSKYKLYPTYDFASPFVDALEGITHALRSSEYRDRDAQYHWIQEDMGVRKVEIYEFSRLNMVYTLLSKRKLLWFVQNGKVDGWDDPRVPTVQGMMRRGLQIDALIQFILEQGASTNQNLMEWDKLWSINKKIIDPVCPRHTAVCKEGRVMVTLTNGPEKPFVRSIPRHKKFEGAGYKCTTYTRNIWIDRADAVLISVDEEVTLMDWGNAIIKEIQCDKAGNIVHLMGVLHLDGSVKTTKLKLTWLPVVDELVELQLVEFDYLITQRKMVEKKERKVGNDKKDKDEDFRNVVNPVTRKETSAFGDPNMRNLKCGDIIQLERKGYYRCDVPLLKQSKPIVLFAIPDGRQQNVSRWN